MLDARDPTRFRDLTLAEFVDRLASPEPIPGGGSAAAVAASLGAALVAMVASLSLGRDRYAEHLATLEEAASVGRRLSGLLLELAEADARAYGRFAAARKLPRESQDQRDTRAAEMAAAAQESSEVPLQILHLCLDVVAAAERIAGRSNVNAASDLSAAVLLAGAAAEIAATNVLENLPAIPDPSWNEATMQTVLELRAAVDEIAHSTRETVGGGEARPPLPPPDGTTVAAG